MKTLLAALAAMLASAAAQTFRVSGTVIDSESGAPLSRTRVALTGGSVQEQSVITTGDGRFSFDAPEGKYSLLAAHRDFGESYGQTRSGNSDSSIVTGPGQDTTNIVMRWHAPIAIHGKVLDENGEPLQAAKVELLVEAVAGGKKHIVSLGRAESDERGSYSLSSFPRGTYYLAATGEPWFFSDSVARERLTAVGTPPVPYALTYFSGGHDAHSAGALTLHAGAELQADFTLRPVTGSNLRFVCLSPPCMGSVSLYAVGIGGTETLAGTTGVLETSSIPAILPGPYIVRYAGSDGVMRKAVEIGGGDVTVEIAPKPVPTLAGKVTFQNPENNPRHPLYVNLLDEDAGESVATPVGANGSFYLPKIPVSRVRILLSGADGFFIARMSVEGASAKDGVIDVVDGATVQVQLAVSGETGGLKGLVVNGGKPVPAAMVVLAPDGSTDPYRYRGFQTDSDGSFDFAAVPAGDYILFAVNDVEFEYASLEIVRPYLASGKRVRIEPHAIATDNIPLTPLTHN